jgi:prepilin-type N-terminal cleavage/methylation domain-containing protein
MNPFPTAGNMNGTSKRKPSGFTLVEILVVIVIIGILMGLAVPAIFTAIGTAKSTKMRLEVGTLQDAVNQYEQKYGDFPPDFSDWAVVERHYRKIFPRISPLELNRLRLLTDVDPSNDFGPASATAALHDPTALDRGEVLAWVLGGYSTNPLTPFTGSGGPLEQVADPSLVVFQINTDTDNKLYDFKGGLDLGEISPGAPISRTNRYLSADGDVFLSFAAHDEGAPFVYFDSRSYTYFDQNIGDFNGYGSNEYGVVRPYFSDQVVANPSGNDYATPLEALRAWRFLEPDTFQIIAPGVDGNFGSTATVSGLPLYYQYPTGKAIMPITGVNAPGLLVRNDVSRFQEPLPPIFTGPDHFQQDNLANFSRAKFVDDVEE